jgi:MerR family copper efflux transcriptional regulator
MEGLKIGELAGRCGVSRDTIRFYEREGLLPRPRRTASQYRVYDDAAENRVRFIRRAQQMGLSLNDVRELLRLQALKTPEECHRVAERLRARIEAVDRQIEALRAFRRQLAQNLERCERATSESCPVILDMALGEVGRKERLQ